MKGLTTPSRYRRSSGRNTLHPEGGGRVGGHRAKAAVGRFIFLMALVVPLVGSQGCYHYYVIADEARNEDNSYSEKTLNTYVWGLLNTQKDGMVSNEATTQGFCPKDYGLYDVRVTRNLEHVLAASLTLGIWAPLKVEWRCAKKPSEEGDPL